MKAKKLNLLDLEVESFVTSISTKESETVNGGLRMGISNFLFPAKLGASAELTACFNDGGCHNPDRPYRQTEGCSNNNNCNGSAPGPACGSEVGCDSAGPTLCFPAC